MPVALFTFFESYDFFGKTICPLITHGGGFSNSLRDIATFCPETRLTEGLAIHGDHVAACDGELEKWVHKIGLK